MHTNPGTPSPEGNPIIKQVYKPGTGTLFASVLEAHGTQQGNQRLVPIAPWTRMRIRGRMEGEEGFIGLAFGDSKGNVLRRVRATQLLTFTNAPEDGDEFTLNGNVWQMIEGGDPTGFGRFDFQIPVADLDGALNNIVAAVNSDDAGVDVIFSTANLPDVSFSAERVGSNQIRFTAVRGGTVGNAFTTTENIGNATFGGATAAGGVDGDIAQDGQVIPEGADFTIDIANHLGEAWLIIDVGGLDQRANDIVVFEIGGDQNTFDAEVAVLAASDPRERPIRAGPVTGVSAIVIGAPGVGKSLRIFKMDITNALLIILDPVIVEPTPGATADRFYEAFVDLGGVVYLDFGPYGYTLDDNDALRVRTVPGVYRYFVNVTEYAIIDTPSPGDANFFGTP